MMGTTHAASGAAVWLAVTATTLPALGIHELPPGTVLLGMGVAAGAALLPDADHHNATIAHSIPIAGSLAAGAVGKLSGGHRKGMHSLIAVTLVTIGMIFLGQLSWGVSWWHQPVHLGAGIAAGACITFALKALKTVKTWPRAWVIGIAYGMLISVLSPEEASWLPLAIGLGYLTHIVGDMLTVGGVPLLWPVPIKPPKAVKDVPVLNKVWLPSGALALPLVGVTGSWREQVLFVALSAYMFWGLCSEAIGGIQLAIA